MLVLSRKKGEKLIITLPGGDLVEITMLNVKGQDVRIGIEAPRSVVVDREEIYQSKLAGKQA